MGLEVKKRFVYGRTMNVDSPRHGGFLELLEPRIAPANFFFSSTSFAVADASGADANNAMVAGQAGAGLALFLKAGDSLYFDSDGDGILNPQADARLMSVTGSSTYVFFSDLNGDGRGGIFEITGLAVGNKFRGSVFTDINGSVATLLDNNGVFNSGVLQNSSIDQLAVTGRVSGNILAGGNISNVAVGTILTPAVGFATTQSVGFLVAGTAADGYDVSFGSTSFLPILGPQAQGSAGASISNITLAAGASGGIGAGAGASGNNGGNGGSITNVSVGSAEHAFWIVAGDGGNATLTAGAGGQLKNISVQFVDRDSSPDPSSPFRIASGAGGSSTEGRGGAGGTIERLHLTINGDALGLEIHAREGGSSGGNAVGGAGGSILQSQILLSGSLGRFDGPSLEGGNLTILAGSGGDAVTGSGGQGGTIRDVTIQTAAGGTINAFEVSAGNGGISSSGIGGGGGGVDRLQVAAQAGIGFLNPQTGESMGALLIQAGAGGAGWLGARAGGNITASDIAINGAYLGGSELSILAGNGGSVQAENGGIAGAGGSIANSKVAVGEISNGGMLLRAGSAGGSGMTPGTGASGGSLSAVALTFQGLVGTNVQIEAGHGSDSATRPGGAGGSIDRFSLSVLTPSFVAASVTLQAGNGGAGSTGGAAGRISGFSGIVAGDLAELNLVAGTAGTGLTRSPVGGAILQTSLSVPGLLHDLRLTAGSGAGDVGGAGGSIQNTVIQSVGGLERVFVTAGAGGTGTAVSGGAGGSISGFRLSGSVSTVLNLAAGEGGNATGNTTIRAAAGHGGSLSQITISGLDSSLEAAPAVSLTAGAGGSADTGAAGGGNGGGISRVSLEGRVSSMTVTAGNGGASGEAATARVAGGSGGSVQSLSLDVSGNNITVGVQAGAGGEGTAAARGGAGGNISATIGVAGFSALTVIAGTGADGGSSGGTGGTIQTLAVGGVAGQTAALVARAGDGGSALVTGNGGNGGSLNRVDVRSAGAIELEITAGAGGSGVRGGQGGSLSNVAFAPESSGLLNRVSLSAGSAGAGTTGAGASGGSVQRISLAPGNLFSGGLEIRAGEGSNVATSGNGGSGGTISHVRVAGGSFTDSIDFFAGNGGSGGSVMGRGGNGGALSNIAMDSSLTSNLRLSAGLGGSGATGGGSGGNIIGVSLKMASESAGGFFGVQGGSGGNALVAGSGGTGGSVRNVNALWDVGGAPISIVAGSAGESRNAAGAAGGELHQIDLRALRLVTETVNGSSIHLKSGGGGSVLSGNGGAGAGGDIRNVSVANIGGLTDRLTILAGDAGQRLDGSGHGGRGGSISNLTIENHAAVGNGGIFILSGNGSSGTGAGSIGGNSGAISAVSITDSAALGSGGSTEAIFIRAAIFAGEGSRYGSTGNVSNIRLSAPQTTVEINENLDRTGSIYATGSSVSRVTGTVGVLSVFAHPGGSSASTAFAGGTGGSITAIDVTVSNRVQILAAGTGGSGFEGSSSGRGGSISNITVRGTGQIGNPLADFGANSSAMGGLFAGVGGWSDVYPEPALNGTISNVRAGLITSIMAGLPEGTGVTTANAVIVNGITATAVGVDRNVAVATSAGRASNDGNLDWGQFQGVITLPPSEVIDQTRLVDGIALLRVGSNINVLTPGLGFIQFANPFAAQ